MKKESLKFKALCKTVSQVFGMSRATAKDSLKMPKRRVPRAIDKEKKSTIGKKLFELWLQKQY